MKITFDSREIEGFEDELQKFKKTAVPFATKNTINGKAFEAQRAARANVRKDFVNRNRFTERSILVEKARTLHIASMEAVVGSTAEYMKEQEFGATKSSEGKHGTRITTSYASGEEGAQPRRKLARKPNAIQNIRLKRTKRVTGSRKRQNVVRAKTAAKSGHKVFYMDTGRTKGIFRTVGGRKNFKVKMLHSLNHTTVRIPRNPWLGPAVARAQRKGPDIYLKELKRQMDRHGLFR